MASAVLLGIIGIALLEIVVQIAALRPTGLSSLWEEMCHSSPVSLVAYAVATTGGALFLHEIGHAVVACVLLRNVRIDIHGNRTVLVCTNADSGPEGGRSEQLAVALAGVSYQLAFAALLCGLAALLNNHMLAVLGDLQAVLAGTYVLVVSFRSGQDGAVVVKLCRDRMSDSGELRRDTLRRSAKRPECPQPLGDR